MIEATVLLSFTMLRAFLLVSYYGSSRLAHSTTFNSLAYSAVFALAVLGSLAEKSTSYKHLIISSMVLLDN